jgi:hypothetical protein
MLVITVLTEPTKVTFRLDGRLAGAGVRELARNWSSAVFRQPHQRVLFDLAGLTSIDGEGREFLARVHQYGDLLLGSAEVDGLDDVMRADAVADNRLSEGPHRANTGAEHGVRIVGNHAFREAKLRRDGELTRQSHENEHATRVTAGDHLPRRVLVG